MNRSWLTDALDLLALLLFAVAVAGGLWTHIGWWSLAGSAVVFIVGSQIIARFQGN